MTADATAYMMPLGGLAMGTGLVDADTALLNAFMTAQTGIAFGLTSAELAALDSTPVPVFRLFAALDASGPSISDVMATPATLRDLADAMLDALSASSAPPSASQSLSETALARLSQLGQSTQAIAVSNILTLGAHQNRNALDLAGPRTDKLTVPALTLVMGYMQSARENTLVSAATGVSLPGLATISVDAVVARPALLGGLSSIAAVGPVGSTVASAAARAKLNVSLLTPLQVSVPLLGTISLPLSFPLILELGYGSATIADVTCGSDIDATTDLVVDATSGVLRLYLGNVPVNQLVNLAAPLTPSSVQIVGTPLVTVNALGQTAALSSSPQSLHFSRADIANGTVRSVDAAQSAASTLDSLANNVVVTVTNVPFGLGSGLVSALVKPQITAVLNALKPVLPGLLSSLGLRAGYADIRATAARCGVPALVM